MHITLDRIATAVLQRLASRVRVWLGLPLRPKAFYAARRQEALCRVRPSRNPPALLERLALIK